MLLLIWTVGTGLLNYQATVNYTRMRNVRNLGFPIRPQGYK